MSRSIFALWGILLFFSLSLQAQWIDDGNNRIRSDRQVSIVPTGSTAGFWHPGPNYKLSVDGFFAADKLLVDLDADWPDYVFEPQYQLMPLTQVAAFIQQQGHLPGLPSTAEVGTTELGVGEAHRLLMEKTEELALYIIQSHKRKEALLAEIERLEALLED